jgi:hypothetical protein
MFKDTCLIAHKRKDQSPRINCFKIPCTVVAPEWNHLIAGHTINHNATNMNYACMEWKMKWLWGFWCKNHRNRSRGWKYMAKSGLRDLFDFSGKCLGWILEFIFKLQGSLWKFLDCNLILGKGRGLFARWSGFPGNSICVLKEKAVDLVHKPWTKQGPHRAWSMVDQPPWPVVKLPGARPMAAPITEGWVGWWGRWIRPAMKLCDSGALVTGGSTIGARVRGAFSENGHRAEQGGSWPLL